MFKFSKFFNDRGEFLPDPDPVVLAPAFDRPPTLAEQMARLIRSPDFKARMGLDEGLESFDEADDFDIDDEYDPRSPWEENFDLAAIGAQDGGVVRPYTQEERARASEAVSTYKKSREKSKKGKHATSLPDKGSADVDPKKSESADPDLD